MSRTQWLIIWLLITEQNVAQAFDPFTAMAAVNTVGSFIGKGDGAKSVMDTFFDFTDAAIDLSDEAKVDPNLQKEADQLVTRLKKVEESEAQIRSLGAQVKDLAHFDLSRTKSLASGLRAITEKVRAGKDLYHQLRGGKKSPVLLQVENLKLNYRMLDELRNIRLQALNEHVEAAEKSSALASSFEATLAEERQQNKRGLP